MIPSAAESRIGWVKGWLILTHLSEESGRISCSDQSG